jgi:hypothetical protein
MIGSRRKTESQQRIPDPQPGFFQSIYGKRLPHFDLADRWLNFSFHALR